MMQEYFRRSAQYTSELVGSTGAFIFAIVIILGWFITGPFFHFSDTWQLIISSITNIVTFIMVFLIQYAQNKDTKAMNVKLDELIRTSENARNSLFSIEDDSDRILNKERTDIIKLVKKRSKINESVR